MDHFFNETTVADGNGVVEKHVVGELAQSASFGSQSAEDGRNITTSKDVPGNEPTAIAEQEADPKTKPCQQSQVAKSAKKSEAKADSNGDSKPKKTTKPPPNTKGTKTPLTRYQKSSLTQSLSLPSKDRLLGSLLKNSVDITSLTTQDKPLRRNARKSLEVHPSLNVSLHKTSDLNDSDGKSTNQVNFKEYKVCDANKHTSTAFQLLTCQSKSAPSGSSESANDFASHGSPSRIQRSKDSELVKESSPIDTNDAKSISSGTDPGGRRNSSSGFVFRSNERAEKRKEFNMKVEEKISAKEAEKCNLLAKSEESQEAEIKQLRKSLLFKATPLPSFYKEPPPKVELKKIPTTRPVSPKLGRNKSSVGVKNASQAVGSFGSSRRGSDLPKSANQSHLNKSVDLGSKKVIRKSEIRIQSQESEAANSPALKSRVKNRTESKNRKSSEEVKKEAGPTYTQPQNYSDYVGDVQDRDNVEQLLSPDDGIIGCAAQREDIATEIMVGG